MTDQNLHPEPQPGTDPDFQLDLPMFHIPTVEILQLLMQMESAAVERVHVKVKGMETLGSQLVDPLGKVPIDVGRDMQAKITDWLHELIAAPTLADDWAGAPTMDSKRGRITTDSWCVAYMLYQELARLLRIRKLTSFINSMDFVLIMGLNAVHRGRLPIEAYSKSFVAKTPDGVPVVGQDAMFQEHLKKLQHTFFDFVTVKRLIEVVDGPDGEGVAKPRLTMAGVRTLNHLTAVLGCTDSMRQQGPALAEALMQILKDNKETKSEKNVMADLERRLLDPNTPIQEA